MSDKMECPGCQSYTSSVLADFENAEPCRYCELPHEAAVAIITVRSKKANADVTALYEEAIKRATRAEAEAATARRLFRDLRQVLDDYERRDAGSTEQ